ncbi:MAG: PPC domain-containing protein, partial [Planctomycetaceae bacterium]
IKQRRNQRLSDAANHTTLDRVDVEITPPRKPGSIPLPFRLRPAQIAVDGFAYRYPGSRRPLLMGLTDVPVVREEAGTHAPRAAQTVRVPCEVGGQLTAGSERDWYAVDVKRGEVLWIEAFGERIGSPVDLDVAVLDATGNTVLARFRDEVKNSGGKRFPSNHLDPSGRWVAPADGRYLIVVRNLIGGLNDDPRRVYRLSLRREVPDFRLVVVPRSDQPASLNVPRGGRVIADVLTFRRRGLTGSIRVSAKNLPTGISCPDVWLGPGVNRAPIVVTAERSAPPFVGVLHLEGTSRGVLRRVRGAGVVRAGLSNGSSRLTSAVPLAVSGTAPLRITADGHEPRMHHLYGKLNVRHSPGGVLDVAVDVEQSEAGHQAPVKLIGLGLPGGIPNQTAMIAAGKKKGNISFYLPPTLPVGTYTIAVRAQTRVPNTNGKGTRNVTVFSNPVTFEVKPAAFVVQIDPYVPTRIRRGEIVQIKYTAKRINGFIGKIHTELAAPQKVIGLRGRGVTFVGQTESGTIQIIANEDAPLGRQPFLRLFAVGVVEDQPAFHGGCFLNLEIVK